MFLSVVLVALGGLSLGATLAWLLAASFPTQFIFLFDWPAALALTMTVATFILLGWWQWSHRFARQVGKPLAHILVQDALAHMPLLFLLPHALYPGTTLGLDLPLDPWGTSDYANLTSGWTLIGGTLAMMTALRIYQAGKLGLLSRIWADRALQTALLVIPLAVYLRTLTPGVGTKDGFELQVVSATLGIAHPTSYPLFTLLGRLFIALVPLGSPAYRINLMCALFAALCAPLVYAIARRVLKHRAPAAVAALTFAFTPTFWTQASIPEKYTLNVWFVALVMYLSVRWAEEADEQKTRWFYGLALAYGLSLTHHRTMLLLAPGLVIWGLFTQPSLLRQPKRLLIAVGLLAAPLLLYLYIPWRAYAQGWQMTWAEFLTQISGSEYTPALRLDEWLSSPERRATYLRFLQNQFGHLGIGLGIIGWLSLLRRNRHFAAFSLVAWVTYVVFSIGYHAYYNDVNYFLPSHLIFALWVGGGIGTLTTAVATVAHRITHSKGLMSLGATSYWTIALLLPLNLIWSHLSEVDMSQAKNGLPWAEYVLSLKLPPRATILADSIKVAPLHYLTTVEKVRPDIDVVVLPDEAAYVEALEAHLVQGLPVYLARYLPNLGGAYHLRSLGPLVEVSLSPLTEPPPLTHPLDARFGEGIRLLGYDAPTLTAPRQGTLHLTLYWQTQQPISESYHIRLRLVGHEGHVWWEEEGHLPVSDHYPTPAWRPGEVIQDYHQVPIEGTLQPGEYQLEVGLFYPFAESGPRVNATEANHVALGTVTVTQGWEDRPPQPTRVQPNQVAPNLLLIGLDAPPEQIRPGDQARLRLYWQALGPLPGDQPSLILQANDREPLHASWPEEYAVSSWPTGEIILTQHAIRIPAAWGGSEGHIDLKTDGTRPGWTRVARFRIEGIPVTGQEAAVNFGAQMLLLDYDFPQNELRPGELFEISINWQGLSNMDEDYTVFVHLLGPDGLSHGQVDVWPHDGTYPTSTWPVGEVTSDLYRVPIDADAPAGRYHVEVGVYLLRTMGRLPVLNADGRPVDDKLLIEGLTVQK